MTAQVVPMHGYRSSVVYLLPRFIRIRVTSWTCPHPLVRPHQRLNQHRTPHRQMIHCQRESLKKLHHSLDQRHESGRRVHPMHVLRLDQQ